MIHQKMKITTATKTTQESERFLYAFFCVDSSSISHFI
jgi:hypothetical protein